MIRPMARLDIVVDHELSIVERAVPDFVIAFAVTNKSAAPAFVKAL